MKNILQKKNSTYTRNRTFRPGIRVGHGRPFSRTVSKVAQALSRSGHQQGWTAYS